MESVAMARKKAKAPAPNRRPVAVVIKGTPEWKAWVESAAKHCRMSVSAFLDFAAAQVARERGYKKEPPER
jgi:hypothetical protein